MSLTPPARSDLEPMVAPHESTDQMREAQSESQSPSPTPSHNASMDMTLSRVCPLPQGAIHFGVLGEGPPVLLIMGFMARGHGWRSQVEALSTHYHLAWFDHRGVGDSPGPAASSMAGFAQDCVALLDHLGWESAHIFGVSMGGMIAQEVALRAPERVRSLTLIVTQAGGVTSVIPPRRGIPFFLRAQLTRTPETRIQALKSLLIPADNWSAEEEREIERRLREEFTPKPPLSTRIRHLWAILRHRTYDRLSTINTPTLVVQAREDLLVKPKHSETIAQLIPHARLLSLSGAGHGVIRQSKIELNGELTQHLSEAETQWSSAR